MPELKGFQKAIGEDGGSPDGFQERLDRIEKIGLLTMEGFQKEMERILTIPGASEMATGIKDECMIRVGPHIEEIDKLLKDIRSSK